MNGMKPGNRVVTDILGSGLGARGSGDHTPNKPSSFCLPPSSIADGLPRTHGQSLLEVAIMGSMAIMALGFLIQIGLRMNFQQDIEQKTFRLAMQGAQAEKGEESQAVSWTQITSRQMPSPSMGFGTMPRTSTQSSATITWGEWLTFLSDDRDSEPKIVVRVNRDAKTEIRSSDMRLQDKATGGDCTAYYRDCASGCDDTDVGCKEDCRTRQEDLCVSVPLIGRVEKDFRSTGTVNQDNAGGRLASTNVGTTRETTKVTLNTRQPKAPLTSTVSRPVNRNW